MGPTCGELLAPLPDLQTCKGILSRRRAYIRGLLQVLPPPTLLRSSSMFRCRSRAQPGLVASSGLSGGDCGEPSPAREVQRFGARSPRQEEVASEARWFTDRFCGSRLASSLSGFPPRAAIAGPAQVIREWMPTVPAITTQAGTRRAVDSAMAVLGSLLQLFQRLECEVIMADSSAGSTEEPC